MEKLCGGRGDKQEDHQYIDLNLFQILTPKNSCGDCKIGPSTAFDTAYKHDVMQLIQNSKKGKIEKNRIDKEV